MDGVSQKNKNLRCRKGIFMKVLYIVGGNGKQNGSEIIAMSILKCLSQEKKVQYTVVTAKDGCVNQLC